MPAAPPKECGRNHGYGKGDTEDKKQENVTDAELEAIIDRLYNTQTECRKEQDRDGQSSSAKNGKTQSEVDGIVERLYQTKTEAMEDDPEKTAIAEDKISRKDVKADEVDSIVDRLYTTHTASSSSGNNPGSRVASGNVARQGASQDEIKEIFQRLQSTQTKSSAGGQDCKTWEDIKMPGLGQKMMPIIEGLEGRFIGKKLSNAQAEEIMNRLKNTHTAATKSRLDFPKLLLYPERTILHNNTERIRGYQASGTMSRQKDLARREKWFN